MSDATVDDQPQSKAVAAAASAAAATAADSTGAAAAASTAPKLTPAEKQARRLKLARFNIYLASLHAKMSENFASNPCLGLHASFGEKEIARLQDAMKRHGREDGFENLAFPVDVLLRTLTFIPNKYDPRVAASATVEGEAQWPSRAMERLCCVNSTLLHTIAENKNLLGSSKPSSSDVERAQAARQEWRRSAQSRHGCGVDREARDEITRMKMGEARMRRDMMMEMIDPSKMLRSGVQVLKKL